MSKFFSAAIIAVVTLSFVVTYAQENNAPERLTPPQFPKWSLERKENNTATRDELMKKRDAWKTEFAAKREEFRQANAETKEKFWNGAKRMLGERFTAAVRNLENAQARVQAIADKKEDSGDAQDLLDASKQSLADAKEMLEDLAELVPAAGAEVTPEIFESIKLKAREAKELLKESHKLLVDAIVELKSNNQ